ncbi:MAG: dTMP kinase [Mycoplasmataceae bacterium]|nr:dTMP kinase [Mycoplasmataceae bacterium]
MAKNNNFISFEGGEGTGKSTAAKLIVKKLNEKLNNRVFLTREPGGNGLPLAESVRTLIMENHQIDPMTEVLLYQASRSEHVRKIIQPKLNEGKIVISDRYTDSSLVYQGFAKNIPLKTINQLNKISTNNLKPFLTFIFDLDPEIGLSRIKNNGRETNRFDHEKLEFHLKVRQMYLKLARQNSKRYIIIDSSKNIDQVVENIYKIIIEKYQKY